MLFSVLPSAYLQMENVRQRLEELAEYTPVENLQAEVQGALRIWMMTDDADLEVLDAWAVSELNQLKRTPGTEPACN
jgi:hypothetical protein